jgi:hypothetical protein
MHESSLSGLMCYDVVGYLNTNIIQDHLNIMIHMLIVLLSSTHHMICATVVFDLCSMKHSYVPTPTIFTLAY